MNHVLLTAAAILVGITVLPLLLGYWLGRMRECDRIVDWLYSQTPSDRQYISIVEDVELGLHRRARP